MDEWRFWLDWQGVAHVYSKLYACIMSEDLTAKAKLRDAAIELIAKNEPFTARSVAEKAGVTPGLIRHHYGSMAGLEEACDDHIAEIIRDSKDRATANVGSVDVLAAIRDSGEAHVMGYLARRLTQGSSRIDKLVDLLAEDATGYIQRAIDAGVMTPLADVPTAARMLTIYSLGALALHTHLERLLDIDITQTDLASQPGIGKYVHVQFEIFKSLMPAELIEQFQSQIPTEE